MSADLTWFVMPAETRTDGMSTNKRVGNYAPITLAMSFDPASLAALRDHFARGSSLSVPETACAPSMALDGDIEKEGE